MILNRLPWKRTEIILISHHINVPYLPLLSADSLPSAFKQIEVLPIKKKQTNPLPLCFAYSFLYSQYIFLAKFLEIVGL